MLCLAAIVLACGVVAQLLHPDERFGGSVAQWKAPPAYPLDCPVWTHGGTGTDRSYDTGAVPLSPELAAAFVASPDAGAAPHPRPAIAEAAETGSNTVDPEAARVRCEFAADSGYACPPRGKCAMLLSVSARP